MALKLKLKTIDLKAVSEKKGLVLKAVSPKKEKSVSKRVNGKWENLLPSDEYRNEFKPFELAISDSVKLVFSVARKGDLGLPHFDVRLFATTDRYSGPTKQGINLSVDKLLDFSAIIQDLVDKCDDYGFFEEFAEE